MIITYGTYIYFILSQNHIELHKGKYIDVHNISYRFKMAAEFKMAADSINCFK